MTAGATGTALALLHLCQESLAPVALAAAGRDAPRRTTPAQVQREALVRWLLPASVGEERDLAMTFVQRFQQRYPGIAIEATFEPPATYEATLAAALASDTPPDLVQAPASEIQAYGLRGVLRDLSPLMQRDGPARDDLFPFLLEQMSDFRKKSTLWAMPKDSAIYVVYYNKDHFDRAGVAYPRADWTFDEFRETARRLTFDKLGNRGDSSEFNRGGIAQWGMDWGGLPTDSPLPTSDLWQNVAWGQAGPWFSDDLTRTYFDDAAHLTFLRQVVQMRCDAHTAPQGLPTEDRWRQGSVAMCIAQYAQSYFHQQERRPFAYDIVPAPAGPWGQYNAASCNGWAVPERAALPEEAWTFLRFLVAPAQQTMMAQTRRFGTALKASALSLAPQSNLPPASFRTAVYEPMMGESAVQTTAIIYPPYYAEMRQIWQAEFGGLFECGAGDLGEAARRAQPQIQALLDRAHSA